MKRCCNLNDRLCQTPRAPRLLPGAGLLVLAVALIFLGLGTASPAQSGSKSLPDHVADMRAAILEAAESGNIEAMGVAIELNELPPDVGGVPANEDDPLQALLSLAPVVAGETDTAGLFKSIAAVLATVPGQDGTLFVWPALALRPPGSLSLQERSDATSILDSDAIAAIEQGGAYQGLRIDIGNDGTWHFIGRSSPKVAD